MPIQILMPALSPTMTEGKLAKWRVKEGDSVSSGDILAEIETDKATMELEAADEGIFGKILVPEGTEGVAVNEPIGVILEEGDDAIVVEAVTGVSEPEQEAEEELEEEPEPEREAQRGDGNKAVSEELPSVLTSVSEPNVVPLTNTKSEADGPRIFASPLARRIAQNSDIDLSSITGTGPNGRIVKVDVEKALGGDVGMVGARRPALKATDYSQPSIELPNSTMRKTIARRLLEAKQTVPHFYLTLDCQIDNLVELRQQLNGRDGADYKLSINDFVIKAAALALRQVPEANASWTDTAIRLYENVDISIAVATDGGLITPVLRKADEKGLQQISNEMQDFVSRAREGKLRPEEYQGGGFSISNLGMYGIREFAAIINPPQSCILAVGTATKQPVVRGGAIAIATVMSCTLSCDHRSVDGVVGARFMQVFQSIVEDPLAILL